MMNGWNPLRSLMMMAFSFALVLLRFFMEISFTDSFKFVNGNKNSLKDTVLSFKAAF